MYSTSLPAKTLLRIWWAMLWPMLLALALLTIASVWAAVLTYRIFGEPGLDYAIVLMSVIFFPGILYALYRTVRYNIGRAFGDVLLLPIDKSNLHNFLPEGMVRVTGRHTRLSSTWRYAITFPNGITYTGIQRMANSSEFRLFDALGQEVARGVSTTSGFINLTLTITRTDVNEPSIELTSGYKLQQFTLKANDTTEIIKTISGKPIELLGSARIFYQWPQSDIWYNPGATSLSQPLVASVLYCLLTRPIVQRHRTL